MKIFVPGGITTLAPENTLDAVLLAAHSRIVDGIIISVRLSRDNQVVLMKDETIDRTTNGTGFVRDMTLEELTRVPMGNKIKRHFIPSLDFLLSHYHDATPLIISLCDEYERNEILVQETVQIVAQYPDLMIAFLVPNPALLSLLNQTACGRPRGLIVEQILYPDALELDGYAVALVDLDRKKCLEVLEDGKQLSTYLVDNREDWDEMKRELGDPLVDAVSIITHYPDRVVRFQEQENGKE